MQFDTQWLLDQKALLMTMISPPQTEDDLLEMNRQLITLIESSASEKVHLLVDTRQEQESIGIRLLGEAEFLNHAKTGWFILVSESGSIQRFVTQIATRLMPISYRQYDNMEEAIAFLEEIENQLARSQSPTRITIP